MNKSNIHKIVTVSLLTAIALGISAASIVRSAILPTNTFSETENRYLQDFPDFSFDNITDRSFMGDFESFVSDRFILREEWIRLKNTFDGLLGKQEIKGIYTENGRMIEAWKGYDEASVTANLTAMNSFAEKFGDTMPVYFMLIPNAQEIYSDTLPQGCGAANQKDFIDFCYESADNLTSIDVYSKLYSARDSYIYYRTDHHWTTLGAYFGYSAAAEAYNFNAYSLDNFTTERASSEFLGTLYSKTLDNSIEKDIIDYYALTDGAPKITLTIPGDGEDDVYSSLYFREYLDKKDKYSSFLGTNVPIIHIDSEVTDKTADKGSLLLIKDSYAHSMVPFLTNNFSKITVIDLRYINAPLSTLGVNIADYDSVLFAYNVITFSEDTNVKKLNFIAE